MFGQKKCQQCGNVLLVDVEVDRKYPQGCREFIGSGAGNQATDYLEKKKRDMNAVGVNCAVCGKGYCVSCMERYGSPNTATGGLGCLDCGGSMTQFKV